MGVILQQCSTENSGLIRISSAVNSRLKGLPAVWLQSNVEVISYETIRKRGFQVVTNWEKFEFSFLETQKSKAVTIFPLNRGLLNGYK